MRIKALFPDPWYAGTNLFLHGEKWIIKFNIQVQWLRDSYLDYEQYYPDYEKHTPDSKGHNLHFSYVLTSYRLELKL